MNLIEHADRDTTSLNTYKRRYLVIKKLYLDIHHHVDGLTAEAVTGAHAKDLETQAKYGVNP